MRILKFTLDGIGLTEKMMPIEAKPISAGFQAGKVVVWAECPEEESPPSRLWNFITVPTGQGIGAEVNAKFIATIVDAQVGFVCHVYHVF